MTVRASFRSALGPLLLLPLLSLVHCGDDDNGAAVAARDGGAAEASASAGPIDASGLAPAAPFSIVREPDTGCIATTTAVPVVLGVEGLDAELAHLGFAGSRLVATAASGKGFALFDPSGAGATKTLIAVGSDTRAAGSLGGVAAVGIDASGNAVISRFDPAGAALGPPAVLGPAKGGQPVAVGRAGEKALVAWAPPGSEVRARRIDEGGAAGPDITLESGAELEDLSVAIAPSVAGDASEFLVVWALRRTALAAYRVYVALVGPAGIVGLPKVLFRSEVPVDLVELVTHPRGGALLANVGGEPVVVPLDVLGRIAGPAHLFEGTTDRIVGGGHGLAIRGESLALVADHASGSHVFRPLDLSGRPLAGWTCLDAPRPSGFQLGSIVADGTSWIALVATESGSGLLRIDL